MKPRCIIVGAGLGGCVVAHGLADHFDVTLIDLGRTITDMQDRVLDEMRPAGMSPHVGAGPGGTTALWHNALIQIQDDVFQARWPFPKSELTPWYDLAYPLLAGVTRAAIAPAEQRLRAAYAALGIPVAGAEALFCPTHRRNLYQSLRLAGRVTLVAGEVVQFNAGDDGRIRSVRVQIGDENREIEADIFVCAAGGLGTPVLLQRLAAQTPVAALAHAGCHYEDHPLGFVALLTLRGPLYKLWNYAVPGAHGNLRLPIVAEVDGLRISFQIRPAALRLREDRQQRMGSALTKLRNRPFHPGGYIDLLRYPDDLLDILSFRLGIRIPTRRYSLLMMAEQPPSAARSIRDEPGHNGSRSTIRRRWDLSPAYLATLATAIQRMIDALGPIVVSSHVLPEWPETLATGAHHSGTARMAASGHDGVCDASAKVIGIDNLYVSDGSLIPASGTANTGLTIAALAARLAAHLRQVAVPPA